MPQPRHSNATGWGDLPPEIVEHILVHLDGPSLLSLVQVNRSLNSLALKELLGPQVSRELFLNSHLFLRNPDARECIPALRAALHFPDPSRISYMPFHWCIYDLLDDLGELSALIKKMQPNTLSSFQLGLLARGSEEFFKSRPGRRPTVFRKWGKLLGQVIDVALTKGCQHLELEGMTMCPYLPPINRPNRIIEMWSSSKRWLSRVLPRAFRNTSPNQLRSLKIAIPDFLTFPLAHYTTSVMLRSSQTLHKLELRLKDSNPMNPYRWSLIFGDAIRLPALNVLILAGKDFTLGPHIVESFLSRHDTITHLELDFSYKYISPDTLIPRFFDRAILPRMTSLSGRPQLIMSLLSGKLPQSDRVPCYPELRYLCISSHCSEYPLDSTIIDRAILSLNYPTHDLKLERREVDDGTVDTSTVGPRLTIRMNLSHIFWVKWIQRHADSGGSYFPSLLEKSRLTRLKVEIEVDELASSWLGLSDVIVIARWLGIFPQLRELEISRDSHPPSLDSSDDQLCRAIKLSCPCLQYFQYNIGLLR